ncbi:hypothetical protein D521_1611 [beta proteobacterium CB]|nr:hypothetical protein D521_1611 [beta proteobacterium CB]
MLFMTLAVQVLKLNTFFSMNYLNILAVLFLGYSSTSI